MQYPNIPVPDGNHAALCISSPPSGVPHHKAAPVGDKILFILTLDRRKMKERIIAGEGQQIQFRLKENADAKVLCDVTRPLEMFRVNFDTAPDNDRNLYGLIPLYNALRNLRTDSADRAASLLTCWMNLKRECHLSGTPHIRLSLHFIENRLYCNYSPACSAASIS